MRKLGKSIYCITFMLFCQVALLFGAIMTPVHAEDAAPASETEPAPLSDTRKNAIIGNCTAIHDSLLKLQKDDSHARVYLGGRYEKIISRFVTPLNTRLVENSLSTPEMVKNQNDLTKAKATFVSDFIDYQRKLETLVNTDCKTDPEKFYAQLLEVRSSRQTVSKDNAKVRSLISDHTKLATALEEKL